MSAVLSGHLPRDSDLTGSLVPIGSLNGAMSPMPDLKGNLSTLLMGGHEVYTGEYTITPKPFDENVLETKNKALVNDVVIKPIPMYETGNESNGYTVYIG